MSRRIAVLLIPTSGAELWRAAFREACSISGFSYLEAAPADTVEGDSLLLSEDPQQGMGWYADTWHVVGTSVEDAFSASLDWIGEEGAAARYVANRLATADMLCRRVGATVEFGTTQTVPGVGRVSIGSETLSADEGKNERHWLKPLEDIYSSLPVDSRTRASFGHEWFSSQTSDVASQGRLDLQGKARLLFAGPKMDIGPGRWALSIALEYKGSTQPTVVRIHLMGQSATKDLVEELVRPGVYELTMDQNISMIASVGVEIHLERAALFGKLSILRCEIRHLSDGGARREG